MQRDPTDGPHVGLPEANWGAGIHTRVELTPENSNPQPPSHPQSSQMRSQQKTSDSAMFKFLTPESMSRTKCCFVPWSSGVLLSLSKIVTKISPCRAYDPKPAYSGHIINSPAWKTALAQCPCFQIRLTSILCLSPTRAGEECCLWSEPLQDSWGSREHPRNSHDHGCEPRLWANEPLHLWLVGYETTEWLLPKEWSSLS